jgi:hypothetical protein
VQGDEFSRFQELTGRRVQVPKQAVDHKRQKT